MKRTSSQNAQLHALVAKLGIDPELKSELVTRFTNGREQSSAQMEVMECQRLINHLNSLGKSQQQLKGVDKGYDPANRMRRKVLSICHEIGWELPNGEIDWLRLNEYLNKYGYLHKPLNDYAYAELPTLVTQFENLLKSKYAKR